MDDQMEPGVLLEEGWFFGNLLDRRKSRMLRCYSDPCPSHKTKSDQDLFGGKSMEETFSLLQKIPEGGKKLNLKGPAGLYRTPSLPPCVTTTKEDSSSSVDSRRISNPRLQRSSQSTLKRAPSMPVFGDKEEFHDEESEFSMGKLIRQASLNHVNVLPPKHTSKGLTRSPSVSITTKHLPRKKQEQEIISNNMEGSEEMRRRYMINQSKTKKSSNGSEIEDLQSFKNLGLNYEKKGSNPEVANTINQGFQDRNKKKSVGLTETEAWLEQNTVPPNWVGKKSAEDMKKQIKFWARAVATNVRQEC